MTKRGSSALQGHPIALLDGPPNSLALCSCSLMLARSTGGEVVNALACKAGIRGFESHPGAPLRYSDYVVPKRGSFRYLWRPHLAAFRRLELACAWSRLSPTGMRREPEWRERSQRKQSLIIDGRIDP